MRDQDALNASPVFQVDPDSSASFDEGESLDDLELLDDGEGVDFADADALLAEVEGVDAPGAALPLEAVAPAAPIEGRARVIAAWTWTGLGTVAALAGTVGIVLTLANSTALEPAIAILERIGLAPIHLLALGLLFVGLGSAARRQGRLHGYIARLNQGQDLIGSMMSNVESVTRTLQEAEARRSEQPASGDEMEFVRFELKRLDEKIVTLTKATRSFGTPLMEMTRQLADVLHTLGEHKHGLDDLAEAGTTTGARLEQMRASLDTGLSKLQDSLSGVVEARLQAANTSYEAQVATHGRHVRESLEALSARMEQALAKTPAPAAAKVDLTSIEQALAAVRRELASLTSNVARGPATAAERAPSPPAAPAPERSAPAPTDALPASGVAQSIAGSRAAPAGNVLGAIARLKQMRG